MNSSFFDDYGYSGLCKGLTIMEHTVNHLADLFKGILTDNDNPLCQALWKELERRGAVVGRLSRR